MGQSPNSIESRIEPIAPERADEIFALIDGIHRTSAFPIGSAWTKPQVAAECAGPGWMILGDDRNIQAFVFCRDLPDAWEISFLATVPTARGQGLMRALLRFVFKMKPTDKAVWLEVHEGNEPARRLYESLGFRVVGRRPNYYPDGGAAVLYNYG